MRRPFARALLAAALACPVLAGDLFSSFEFTDQTGSFTLGSPPRSATFLGGEAKSTGNFSLYHSGSFAWMITPGNTGEIVFQTGAERVDLFLLDETATVNGVLTVFGTDGAVITTINSTHTSWIPVSVGSATQPVGRITLQHNGAAGHSVIDDLTYCALGNIGANYCGPGAPNSSGQSGSIQATGSVVVSLNALTLTASQLPQNQFAMFVNSKTQGFAQPPGSQGFLCLGGGIGRHNAQLANTGSAGLVSIIVDMTALPTPGGAVVVQAGETWNFQAWHRDQNPGSTSNFSDGISILYQ